MQVSCGKIPLKVLWSAGPLDGPCLLPHVTSDLLRSKWAVSVFTNSLKFSDWGDDAVNCSVWRFLRHSAVALFTTDRQITSSLRPSEGWVALLWKISTNCDISDRPLIRFLKSSQEKTNIRCISDWWHLREGARCTDYALNTGVVHVVFQGLHSCSVHVCFIFCLMVH